MAVSRVVCAVLAHLKTPANPHSRIHTLSLCQYDCGYKGGFDAVQSREGAERDLVSRLLQWMGPSDGGLVWLSNGAIVNVTIAFTDDQLAAIAH